MLQHAEVERVAGDGNAGFYRRRFDSSFIAADCAKNRVEAYSWGGLTAGAGQRALWLLLTPFMLTNLAYWALPEPPLPRPKGEFSYVCGTPFQQRVRRLAEAMLRLFALSVTATFVMAIVLVSMDLIGWQCLQTQPNCTGRLSWLGFLEHEWLATPGRRVAVMSVVPLAAIALLWQLSRKTWLRLEDTDMPARESASARPTEPPTPPVPLESRSMWNGRAQVQQLQSLHIAAAIATVGLFLMAPIVAGAGGAVPTVILAAHLAVLIVTAALACWSPLFDRPDPSEEKPRRNPIMALPAVAGICLLAAAVAATMSPSGSFRTEQSLPWLTGAMQWLLIGQFVVLAAMFVLLVRLHTWRPEDPAEATDDPAGTAVRTPRPAWRGQTALVLMIGALVMADGFAAGLGIRVADIIGEPVADGSRTYVLPAGYLWAAALTVPLVLLVLLLGAVGWFAIRWRAERSVLDEVGAVYGVDRKEERRATVIAKDWARADAGTVGAVLAGAAAAVVALLIAIGFIGYLIDPQWIHGHLAWMVKWGSFLVGAFVLGMLWVGRQAYRNPSFRRSIGVLWDIGTFWPRAAHPLAPPCYAERAIPDLITRIDYLTSDAPDARVLLSAHSQGSVIAAAVVLQLDDVQRGKVALLTYGSPLRRLYARFFPGYFGSRALLRTGAVLSCTDDRSRWPWRNLYRRSDPIGGEVLVDVDRQLIDPAYARSRGDTCDPETYGHSDYYLDPGFGESITVVRDIRAGGEAGRDSTPGLLVTSSYGASGSG